jgi:outer membrane protein TolC
VPNYSFPVFLDNTLLQATLTIPVSDYFLRIDQAYTAATRSAEAARFDVGAARATALSNGKVAYYTWLQARGAIVVAVQALNDQRIHLNDARNQFTVGNASKADVLRAETSVAQAELAVVTAENAAELAETQMRIAIHAPAGQRLVPGEGLDTSPAPFGGQLAPLVSEAVSQRFELKSIMANAASAKKTSEANKAARFPVISLFADGIEGNPNSRYFPPSQDFNFTWDVGAQATWAPNDILTANGGANDFAARARALEAQAQVTLEGIQVEVTQNYEALKNAEFSLESTRRELASATEAYRVARELFNNGRGTSTTLTDAERDLTVARIDALNAQVNARIQRVRLEHAAGRDLRGLAVAP